MRRLNVMVDADLFARFKAQCAVRGVKMTDVIREWLTKWLSDKGQP